MENDLSCRRLLLTPHTVDDISHLRRDAYVPKFGTRLHDEALLWGGLDDQSFHFGYYENERLVSTIRLTFISTPRAFETVMQLDHKHQFSGLPCWVLGRAATLATHRGLSINMKVRIAAYRFLEQRHSGEPLAKYLYGSALKATSRLALLQSIGYEIIPAPQDWQGYIDAKAQEVVLFRLPLEKLNSAISELQKLF